MLARIVWPKYLLSTYRAFSIHSTSLSSHVFSSISFNKSEHQLFNWALRAFGKRTRTIVKATQYIHSKYVNVCFLLCWPLKCVGVCFVLPLCISLYFLAPNPLIILTDPSPAKIQNQHAHSHIQSEYSALLQPPPWPGLSPGWSQSLQSLAVPGSNALSGCHYDVLGRSRIDGAHSRSEIVPRPCSASFIFCPNIPLITTTSTFV